MKKYYSILILFIPFLLLSQNPRFEVGYPEKGLLDLPLGVGKTELYDAMVQPDGKALICGSIRKEAGVNNPARFVYFDRNYLLIRHLANGNPDSTFGNNGVLTLDNKDQSEYFFDINLDQAGNIFLLGKGRFETYIAKLLPDGNRDENFGENGFFLAYDGVLEGEIRDLLIKPDGKMLLCGTKAEDFFLLQYHADGTIDTDFGNQGSVQISLGMTPHRDDALVLALQDNGRILIGGQSNNFPTVVAVLSNGGLDTTFNNQGFLQLQSTENEGRIEQFHLFPDQSFIAAGSKAISPRNAFFVTFQANGQLDSTRFGQAIIEPKTQEEQNFRSMAVSAKGEIFYQSFYDKKFLLTKLTPQGRLDSTFGFAGQTIFTIENQPCYGNNVMLQPSGKILMSGGCPPSYALVCLDSVGRFENTFQQSGFITRKVEGGGSAIWNLHKLKDQSLIATGHSYAWQATEGSTQGEVISHGQIWKFDEQGGFQENFNLPLTPGGRGIIDLTEAQGGNYLVAGDFFPKDGGTLNHEPFIKKMAPDGQPDLSFGDEGIVMLKRLFANTPQDPFQMLKISEGTDQKIWVAFHHGFFPFGSNTITKYAVLARLMPNGALDTTFYDTGYLRVRVGDPLEITDLIPQDDESVLVAGYALKKAMGLPSIFVVKITSGEVFQSFGEEVTTHKGLGFPNANVMAGGKIVQKPTGEIQQGCSINGDFLLFQYSREGILNQALGDRGEITQEFEMGPAIFSDMALAPNGDVLMLGYIDNRNTARYEAVIVCFDAFGELKTDFGDQGIYSFHLETPYTYPETISMDTLGNFMVAGSAGSEAFALRFLSDLHLEDPTTLPPTSIEKPLVYPNPIQSETKISYSLTEEQFVRIQWVDLLGRQIATSYEGTQSAGPYLRFLEVPEGLISGHYFIKFQIGETMNYVKVQVL